MNYEITFCIVENVTNRKWPIIHAYLFPETVNGIPLQTLRTLRKFNYSQFASEKQLSVTWL